MTSYQRAGCSSILQNIGLAFLVISVATNISLLHPTYSGAITKIPSASIVVAFEPTIPPRPSHIGVDNVSQKYPVTLMNTSLLDSFTTVALQKLFSSVPKREYAVQNINLSFGHETPSYSSSPIVNHDDGVTLLVGRSASGKSTLLRLLAGMELPIDGCVTINGRRLGGDARVGLMPGMPSWVKMGFPSSSGAEECYKVQPVILQGKPEFDDTLSVIGRIVQTGLDTVNQCNNELKIVKDESSVEETNNLLQNLAHDLTSLLTISKEQCASPPSELSPSGEYLFGIACSCMMSIAPSIAIQGNEYNDCISQNGFHYPILLFDELFDTEHPSTVEKCNRGILNLISAGAVVISATHRPGHFMGMASRTVTLSGGKVLMDEADASFSSG
ncbi:hypothetical protein ACHAXR_007699 [Thalassiosira sp. AJA248-18]